jgi:hypothetical protein
MSQLQRRYSNSRSYFTVQFQSVGPHRLGDRHLGGGPDARSHRRRSLLQLHQDVQQRFGRMVSIKLIPILNFAPRGEIVPQG